MQKTRYTCMAVIPYSECGAQASMIDASMICMCIKLPHASQETPFNTLVVEWLKEKKLKVKLKRQTRMASRRQEQFKIPILPYFPLSKSESLEETLMYSLCSIMFNALLEEKSAPHN